MLQDEQLVLQGLQLMLLALQHNFSHVVMKKISRKPSKKN